MKKTIAQQLGITDFPFEIKDKQGNLIYKEVENGFWEKWEYDERGNKIYFENSDGFWVKWEYDSNGKEIYFENSDGFWVKREYDLNGKEIYFENSDGFWVKREWNSNGKQIYYENLSGWIKWEYDSSGTEIYYENSNGEIIDNRPKPEPTPTITLQQCLDRGFTVEKIEDPIYKEQHGKDYMLCYLKLSKRHMIDYCNATYRCMVYKVDAEGTILERKYLKDVSDLDFYIRFLGSEKRLRKLPKF